jgi:hypothetical protein
MQHVWSHGLNEKKKLHRVLFRLWFSCVDMRTFQWVIYELLQTSSMPHHVSPMFTGKTSYNRRKPAAKYSTVQSNRSTRDCIQIQPNASQLENFPRFILNAESSTWIILNLYKPKSILPGNVWCRPPNTKFLQNLSASSREACIQIKMTTHAFISCTSVKNAWKCTHLIITQEDKITVHILLKRDNPSWLKWVILYSITCQKHGIIRTFVSEYLTNLSLWPYTVLPTYSLKYSQ